MRVVLDTNVLVSALLTSQGPSARVLNLILQEAVAILIDERILDEYQAVLKRPKFGFDEEDVNELMEVIDQMGEFVIATPLPFAIPDVSDLPFLEVALAGNANVLITGNKKDYGKPPEPLKILNPREFLDYQALKMDPLGKA
ncbi:MAG: putative toxin-antitoxin system toxin component, PIN family [Deltaproteobacteria bacterium]|nr:putative toxin-antitoxin system toxin component, PIN family [Deltaproteobacteria bacterium]